jgi:S-formylglutathione hydrolase FrmB
MGYSQGGFASLWIATQSRRYKAVVSLNGWSDLTSDFFAMDWSQQLAPTEIRSEGDEERYLASVGSLFSMGGHPVEISAALYPEQPSVALGWRIGAGSTDPLGHGRI